MILGRKHMTETRAAGGWRSRIAEFIPWRYVCLAAGCSALFFLLAADIRYHGPLSRWDQRLTNHLHAAETHKIFFFSWITEFGGGSTRKLLWIFALPLALSKRWYHLSGLLLAVVLGGEINTKLQNVLGRHRPTFDDIALLTHPGFPSGHTANACFFFGYVALIFWIEYGSSKAFKLTVLGIGLAIILLVAASRAALLVHYTGDVVGSFLWCSAWIIFCYFANRAALRICAQRMNHWLKNP